MNTSRGVFFISLLAGLCFSFFSVLSYAAVCPKGKVLLKSHYAFSSHAVKKGASVHSFKVIDHRKACIKGGSTAAAHMFCKKLKKHNYKKTLCYKGMGHLIIDKRTGHSIGSRSHCRDAFARLHCP